MGLLSRGRLAPACYRHSVLSLLALALVSQPDLPGSFANTSATNVSVTLAAATVTVDLYWPTDPGPFPAIVLGHGFARSAAVNAGWGAHLASHGFVVAVPTFPTPVSPNHVLNGQIMRQLLAWMRTAPAPIGARADASRGAYVGHSAGGLAAFLAAAADPSITALVGLDPVDANDVGAMAAPMIAAPTLVLAARPQACNAQGSAGALYGALAVPSRWFLRVTNATHCDAEDPSNALCGLGCMGQDAMRRAFFRRYATAHLLGVFRCQEVAYLPGGSALAADLSASSVGELAGPGPGGCGGADAGVAVDATAPDLGVADDAGPSDAGLSDVGSDQDLGTILDAAPVDGGAPVDADLQDSGLEPVDAGASAIDASADVDAAAGTDSAVPADAAVGDDAKTRDAASAEPPARDSGCGCATTERPAPGALVLAGALLLAGWRRRLR